MTTYYLNDGQVTGNNNGSDWTNSFQSIDALESLSDGDIVYVKEHSGIDRSNDTLQIANGITIYGGCDSSLTGTQTSPRTGYTSLDGNSTAVRGVRFSGAISSPVVMERFKIHHFKPSSQRAGVSVETSAQSVTLNNCIIEYNESTGSYGGGVGTFTSTLTLNHCQITNNEASSYGGGVANGSTGTVTCNNCIIGSNTAGSGGGGVNGAITLNECWVKNNTVTSGTGGGLRLIVTAINCIITGNSSSGSGAAGYIYNGGSLVGCTVMDNGSGSTNMTLQTGVTISNSIFWGNSATDISGGDSGCVDYCDVEDSLGSLEGTGCVSTNPYVLGSGDDPYQLTGSTPSSVTQGANTGVTGYVDYDYLDVDRDNSTPSMGCYEYVAASDNEFTAEGELPLPTGSAQFTQENAATAAGELPVPTGSAQFENVNTFTANAETPVPTGTASFNQENAVVAAGELQVPTGTANFEQANELTATGELPLPEGSAALEQQNALTAAADLPVPTGDATFTQENTLSAAGDLPVPTGVASFENVGTNEMTSAGVTPVLEGAGVFENEAPNEFTAAGDLPSLEGVASFEQNNLVLVAGELQVPIGTAGFEQANEVVAAGEVPLVIGTAQFTQENAVEAAGELPLPVGAAELYNLGENVFTGAATLAVPVGSADFVNQRPVPPFKGCMTVSSVASADISVGPVYNSDMEVDP